MREQAGGIISATLPYNFCRALELPFLHTIYKWVASRYPIINVLYENKQNTAGRNNFSISLDHIDVETGLSDSDRALTISTLGEIVDDFKGETNRVNLLKRFSSTFQIPGHVNLFRASHGLLRRNLGISELSIALCEISDQPLSTVVCRIISDEQNEIKDYLHLMSEENDYPLVEKQVVINLWRSIKKVPKDEIVKN
jgi:3,4-dihydroxy 2-butanone 4-phosphate synthase